MTIIAWLVFVHLTSCREEWKDEEENAKERVPNKMVSSIKFCSLDSGPVTKVSCDCNSHDKDRFPNQEVSLADFLAIRQAYEVGHWIPETYP